MKAFRIMLVVTTAVILFLFVFFNLFLFWPAQENNRPYRVEIHRLAEDIRVHGLSGADLSAYPSVLHVEQLSEQDTPAASLPAAPFFEGGSYDYLIRQIDGIYYRFDYVSSDHDAFTGIRLAVNLTLAVISIFLIGLLLFIKYRILLPFERLNNVPYELSKGNLTVPLKEEKNRFFGRFIWGLDLLQEHLEEQQHHELQLQKEKKTLILSLSHDIKTPLLAIRLYNRALSEHIYREPQKNREITTHIDQKVNEIEDYVSQIISASREDFLHLSVNEGEFYLSELISSITEYYSEKLALLQTDFFIAPYDNCLLKGDLERAIEILQNIIENAVKYGDGSLIRIDFSDEENCRLITVTNHGCTLSEHELPHIFDSFYRGSNVGDKRGNGLGLYICRQLIHLMGGEIYATIKEDRMSVTVLFVR